MRKIDIMKQRSLGDLLSHMITSEPGVTSDKLWKAAKEWDHELLGIEFDAGLAELHGKYRVTNQQWYPIGHVAEPRRKGPAKEEPRQTRMFG